MFKHCICVYRTCEKTNGLASFVWHDRRSHDDVSIVYLMTKIITHQQTPFMAFRMESFLSHIPLSVASKGAAVKERICSLAALKGKNLLPVGANSLREASMIKKEIILCLLFFLYCK